MSTGTASLKHELRNPVYQSFLILRVGFTLAPILFGIDKFFNWTVQWPNYLAPWINNIAPGTAQQFMYAVGAIEIVAGLVVAFAPRFGGYLVATWLGGIIVSLLTAHAPRFYDVVLRDFGLLLGALTLGRLAAAFATRAGARSDLHRVAA